MPFLGFWRSLNIPTRSRWRCSHSLNEYAYKWESGDSLWYAEQVSHRCWGCNWTKIKCLDVHVLIKCKPSQSSLFASSGAETPTYSTIHSALQSWPWQKAETNKWWRAAHCQCSSWIPKSRTSQNQECLCTSANTLISTFPDELKQSVGFGDETPGKHCLQIIFHPTLSLKQRVNLEDKRAEVMTPKKRGIPLGSN